jgi:hypothetical protein
MKIKVGTKVAFDGVVKEVTEIQVDLFNPTLDTALFDDGTTVVVTKINENDIVLPTEFDLRYTHDIPDAYHGRLALWIYKKLFRGCVLDEANLKHVYHDGMIAKKDLVVGATYIGHCRNATMADWNGIQFEYIREKFGNEFLDYVEHPEDDRGHDIFVPTLKLDNIGARGLCGYCGEKPNYCCCDTDECKE